MSCTACCDCKTPSCALIPNNQRPSNGVWKVNKLFAKQSICTPCICGPDGTINVCGVIIGNGNGNGNGPVTKFPCATFGERNCYTTGLVAQTNTNLEIGVFAPIDLTADQYDVLAGNTTNNCLYIGSDDVHVGFKYIPKLAEMGLSEDSVWEYWNGSTWVNLCLMAAQSVSPHTQFANTPFERISSDIENVRIQDISASWMKNTLNSINKFWLRMCLTDGITNIPNISKLQLLASHTKICEGGFLEHFGASQTEQELVFHRKLLEEVTLPPVVEDLDITATFVIKNALTEFMQMQDRNLGSVFRIPRCVSTSEKLKLAFTWYVKDNTAGDVEWFIEFVPIKTGDLIDGTLPSTTLSKIVSVNNQQEALIMTEFEIPISTLMPFNLLGVKIERQASGGNPNDTYADSAVLVDFASYAKCWK